MPSELDELRSPAEEPATKADGRPEAVRARHLLDRLSTGQILVAVVGEFKRRRPTLVNALLGQDVVPTCGPSPHPHGSSSVTRVARRHPRPDDPPQDGCSGTSGVVVTFGPCARSPQL
jgi:hypothetical protein